MCTLKCLVAICPLSGDHSGIQRPSNPYPYTSPGIARTLSFIALPLMYVLVVFGVCSVADHNRQMFLLLLEECRFSMSTSITRQPRLHRSGIGGAKHQPHQVCTQWRKEQLYTLSCSCMYFLTCSSVSRHQTKRSDGSAGR